MKQTTVISFCKKVTKPFRWQIIVMLIIATVCAANVSIKPYIIKIIINRFVPEISEKTSLYLLLAILAYLSMSLIMAISYRLYDILNLKTFPRLKKNITNALMARMVKHSYGFYQNNFTGSLVNKINNVVDAIPEMIEIFITRFFVQILSLIIAAYTLWQVSPKFSYAITIWSTIFIFISIIVGKKAIILSDDASEVRSNITGKITDIITNIVSVRLFSADGYENSLLNCSLNKGIKTETKFKWFLFKIWIFQGVSFFILESVCLYLLMVERALGTVTAGDFALILTINILITDLIWNVFKDFTNFSRLLGQTTQGLRTIMSSLEISDISHAKKLIVKKGDISFENVCFNYPGIEPLFSNKSLTINARQKVGLVGYSGSGKTTFVNLILRLFEIQSGSILVDGQNINDVTQGSLLENIAVITQDPLLFHRSLMENIRYGRLQATDEEVINASKKAFAHEFINSFPDKYETLVGERGIKLSAGQRQRIAIARAILKNAPILILDEATSSLDSATESQIQESLRELMQNKTTIVIAHRLSTLLHMERILVFDQGKIIEDGSHQELINKQGLYKTLWDTQTGGFLPDMINNKPKAESL